MVTKRGGQRGLRTVLAVCELRWALPARTAVASWLIARRLTPCESTDADATDGEDCLLRPESSERLSTGTCWLPRVM